MSTTTGKEPDPSAALIVFGRLDGVELPQAAWFKKEDSQTAETAAAALKLSVIKLQSPDEKALAVGVSEGSVKSSGRILLGSVAAEIYRRIEERARATASNAPAADQSNATPAPAPRDAWDELQPGSIVLAIYWDKKNQEAGWWPAVITKVHADGCSLKWRESPEIPLGRLRRKHIAILHPDYLASLK
jgi:hypothetical protein